MRRSYTMHVRTDEGDVYEHVERIGPIPGEAFETLLLELGGDAHVTEVIRAMKRDDRPSRFLERHASKLAKAGMIRITEDQRLIVLPSWAASLGLAREIGGEYEAEKAQEDRHKRQRAKLKLLLSGGKRQPEIEDADGHIEDLERIEDPEPPAQPLTELVQLPPHLAAESRALDSAQSWNDEERRWVPAKEHLRGCGCLACDTALPPGPVYAAYVARQ